MKKVLLATTILGMTAGYAAAEIAFTGEATAGFASDAGGDYDSYTSFNLGVAATAESDAGVSFGASFDVTNGTTFDFTEDAGARFDATHDGSFGNPEVFISGDFGRVAFSIDGFADFHEDDGDFNDVEYTHTIGDFSIGLRNDIDGGTSSLQLGYNVAGIALGANFDEATEDWDVSAERAFDAVTVGVELSSTADVEVTTLTVGYEANGLSVGLEVDNSEPDNAYTLSAGYEANGLAIGASLDEADDWEVTADYDLGNGLAVQAGIHRDETAFLGAKMSF